MNEEPKSRRGWRIALIPLIIFSYIAAFVVDANLHIEHSGHEHDAHDLAAAHVVDVENADALDRFGPADPDDAPNQASFGDPFHGCLVFLVPPPLSLPSPLSGEEVWAAAPQYIVLWEAPKLHRPPISLS